MDFSGGKFLLSKQKTENGYDTPLMSKQESFKVENGSDIF